MEPLHCTAGTTSQKSLDRPRSPCNDASERVGPGRLASDQLGAGCPTRAVCDDAVEPAPLLRSHAATEHAAATARHTIHLSITWITNLLNVASHLLRRVRSPPQKAAVPARTAGRAARARGRRSSAGNRAAMPRRCARHRRTGDWFRSRPAPDNRDRRNAPPPNIRRPWASSFAGTLDVCGGETQRVPASRSDLDQASNLIAGAAQQTIGLREIALADQRTNSRARDTLARIADRIHRNELHATLFEKLGHQHRRRRPACGRTERSCRRRRHARRDARQEFRETLAVRASRCRRRTSRRSTPRIRRSAKSARRSCGVQSRAGSVPGLQVCRRMIRERQNARTPAGLAQPQRLARDLAMAAMKTVEETDCQHQRAIAFADELVTNLH